MSQFPGGGFYRGDLDSMIKDSIKAFDALPADKQAEMRALQRESWARGELAMGNDKQEAEDRAKILQSPAGGNEVRAEEPTALAPSTAETLTQGEVARQAGYTGDQCSNCNSMRMRIAGHCMVCEDCGTTTGCS